MNTKNHSSFRIHIIFQILFLIFAIVNLNNANQILNDNQQVINDKTIENQLKEVFDLFKTQPKTNDLNVQEFFIKCKDKLKPIEEHTTAFLKNALNLKNLNGKNQFRSNQNNGNNKPDLNKLNEKQLKSFKSNFRQLKSEINTATRTLIDDVKNGKAHSIHMKHKNKHNRALQATADNNLSLFEMFEQCLGKLADLPASIYCMVLGCNNNEIDQSSVENTSQTEDNSDGDDQNANVDG